MRRSAMSEIRSRRHASARFDANCLKFIFFYLKQTYNLWEMELRV